MSRKKSVMQITKTGKLVKVWDSMTQAASNGKFIQSCIANVCSGKRKTHRGYIWKESNEGEL